MPSLLFLRDNTQIFRHHLDRSVHIGRGEDCLINLTGQSISRAHCEVVEQDGSWRLRDLGSRHGTRLNGNLIQETALCDGDLIEIGEITALFEATSIRAETTFPVAMRRYERLLAIDDGIHVTRSILRAVEGPDEGKTWPLKWGRCTIGGPNSRVPLSDPEVCRDHCLVVFSLGGAVVMRGRGTVVVAGEHIVEPTSLQHEAEFCIGSTRLRLERKEQELSITKPCFGEMRSDNAKMTEIFGTLAVVSGHAAPILIQGESGTGKELAARGIHQHSGRAGAFVAVNCGGVSGRLWESELFGHEKGAFTGANTRRDGYFQQAHGGTLFLDEIGDLPMDAQVRLLRALGEGEIRRVGGQSIERPDVRVITATNRNLLALVEQGRFRSDLFFRLSDFLINLPPLRERPEDITFLASHLLSELNPRATLSAKALGTMQAHSWPGNVRELRQVLTRALCGRERITEKDLNFYTLSQPPSCLRERRGSYSRKKEQFSRAFLKKLMESHENNREAAARSLGLTGNALKYRLVKAGLLERAPR